MKTIDILNTNMDKNYKSIYLSNYENNSFYSSSSFRRYKNKIKFYPPSKKENSNFQANDCEYLPFKKNSSGLYYNQINNTISNISHNNSIKIHFDNYNKNDSEIKIKNNKYLNIYNIPKSNHRLNKLSKPPILKNIKNISKQILDKKNNNNSTNITTNNVNKIPNSSRLNVSSQKHNHSFFEVKSLSKDFVTPKLTIKIKNTNSNKDYIYDGKEKILNKNKNETINNNSKRYGNNKIFKIKYNINNNINVIINSKNVNIFNKNKIIKKNITTAKLIKYNNKRHELSSTRINKYKLNKINSYFFSYFPKLNEKKVKLVDNKSNKLKKNKKLKNENKLILKNLNYKAFEEDFPIKIKYNRNYRINKKLKPQISLRLTLFKVSRPEIERFFLINFFYSENLRISEDKKKLEYFF